PEATIHIAADYAVEWGTESGSVAVLRGHCLIEQGDSSLAARQMVVWRETGQTVSGPVETLTIYLEGDSRYEQPGRTFNEQTQFVTLRSPLAPQVKIGQVRTVNAPEESPLYLRALKRYQPPPGKSVVQQVQHTVIPESEPEIRSVQFQPSPAELRRVRVFPRSAVPYNVLSFESNQSTPPEQIWVLTGGVNLIVDGLDSIGTVDLAADRMVIWTRAGTGDEFRAETVQSRDTPFQVYLEGNIVVRQGQSVLRATSGVYDAREDRAMLMNAELRTFIPQLQGDLRIRAQRIRQLSRDRYYAQNAWTSGSQFGKPGYRLQASEVYLENRPANPWIGPGGALGAGVSPDGTPVQNQVPYIRSQGNTFFIEDVPLLYVPYLAAPADDPNLALRRASVRNDDIFGTQLKTVWDMYQLLGLEAPAGTEWDLYADYLSDRGPAVGTGIEYQGTDLFGIAGRHRGEGLLYYIHDSGTDNLGLGRRELDPAKTNRFRAQHRHRQELSPDLTIQSELGWLSDRNFLEQYYENEFDEGKDVETLIYVRQQFDNWALTALGRPQLNNFETTTEWLPRGDLYGLGQPLAGGWLNWSSHSSAGYGRLSPADAPDDPMDLYDAPEYYLNSASGAVLMTRHEINAPFMLGPLNVVPFAMGEAAFWGDDGTGDSLDRLMGSAGLRTSLSFWKAYPYVSNRIFNLNGLAHKIRLEADYIFTDVSEDLSAVPIYNEFDDNAQER
ncbi:MAG: hypothetical protein KDA79_23275, partial [Planctomycetaceae bacterium]|nr:hypothetical protein [Planctomycetaceae bacterium]